MDDFGEADQGDNFSDLMHLSMKITKSISKLFQGIATTMKQSEHKSLLSDFKVFDEENITKECSICLEKYEQPKKTSSESIESFLIC